MKLKKDQQDSKAHLIQNSRYVQWKFGEFSVSNATNYLGCPVGTHLHASLLASLGNVRVLLTL